MGRTPYRQKTLSLLEAYFSDGFTGTVEEAFVEIFSKLPNATDLIIQNDFFLNRYFAEIEIIGNDRGEGIFVRILEFEEGAIGAINFNTANNSATVEEFFHPNNQNFLKDEFVLYVIENHIIACNLKQKRGVLAENIIQLARSVDFLNEGTQLKIEDIPNKSAIEKIDEIGVKEVIFPITKHLVDFDGTIGSHDKTGLFSSLFSQTVPEETVQQKLNTIATLTIKTKRISDSTKPKVKELDKNEWLSDIGKKIFDDDSIDDFKIILKDGTKILSSMLKKSRPVKIRPHANSFSFEHAKMELRQYYIELQQNGYL